jgi:hypothetical protein
MQRALASSRTMQSWREFSVREAVLREPKPALCTSSASTSSSRRLAFAMVGHLAAAKMAWGAVKGETRPSILAKMQEARDYALLERLCT